MGVRRTALIGILCAGGLAAFAFPGGSPDGQFPYPDGEEIHQRVARVSFVGGAVSLSRGDEPGVLRAAAVNEPLAGGDRILSGKDGRFELELQGGNVVAVGPRSEVLVLNLVEGGTQLAVRSGVASILLRRLLDGETFEVDTPAAAVTLQQAGEYRVDVDAGAAAGVHVTVRRGGAAVAAGGGEISVEAGRRVRVTGTEAPRYDVEPTRAPDAFDGWAEERGRRFREVRSSAHVNSEVLGVADLDEAGHWENTRDFGNAWTPSNVDKDWQPYRAGRWLWQDPWGWTWVSEEPWGWAPYHYGRWAVYPSGWFWVPEGWSARYVSYSPALVAFLGGGADGWAATGFRGGAEVGWFPLALGDPFYPWWIPRSDVRLTRATEFVYRNRRSVTVVPAKAFASGESVRTRIVRDAAVLDEAVSAPVLRVPLPLPPAEEGARPARAGKPAASSGRPVVVRAPPPPGPPALAAKLETVRQHGGAPVPPSVAIRILQAGGGKAATAPLLIPAVRADGRMTLAPRRADASTPLPRPLRPAAVPAPVPAPPPAPPRSGP